MRVGVERVQRAVAPVAGVLDAAERRRQRRAVERVDPHRAGAQAPRDAVGGRACSRSRPRRRARSRCRSRARSRARRRRRAGSRAPGRTPPPGRSRRPGRAPRSRSAACRRRRAPATARSPPTSTARRRDAAASTRAEHAVQVLLADHRAEPGVRRRPGRPGANSRANSMSLRRADRRTSRATTTREPA